ncbi:ANTAR domain-containing protein [Auraticoccus monumenti]|nr:ANTAR domain-containing protein [Auraticoccus monumenti]
MLDYEAVFDATPTPYLVLSPDLVIVGMNRAREEVTQLRREDVVGRGLFEMFPDPPDDETATGVSNLHASLLRVLATKQTDTMPVQKYALHDPESGTWTERWWSPVNVPVLDDDGEVTLLLHRVTEVTAWMLSRAEQQQAMELTLHDADSDLYARAQELHRAWMQASADMEHFRQGMLSQRINGQAVGLLMAKLNTDADRAFALLVQESQHRNIKLRDLAEEVVARHGT